MTRLRLFSFHPLKKKILAGKWLIKIRNLFFPGSALYWEKRYGNNGNSGKGSYTDHAAYKADFLNHFVKEKKIHSVVELGCGDGNQVRYFGFEHYTGVDVAPAAIERCSKIFKGDLSKAFLRYIPKENKSFSLNADLAISLDVIYHLVEDDVYARYMFDLFSSAGRYVIIYAWDVDDVWRYHIRHRRFSTWISENISDFKLVDRVSRDSFCDFFVYERVG